MEFLDQGLERGFAPVDDVKAEKLFPVILYFLPAKNEIPAAGKHELLYRLLGPVVLQQLLYRTHGDNVRAVNGMFVQLHGIHGKALDLVQPVFLYHDGYHVPVAGFVE